MEPRVTPESASPDHADRMEHPVPMDNPERREHVDSQEVLVHLEMSLLMENVF